MNSLFVIPHSETGATACAFEGNCNDKNIHTLNKKNMFVLYFVKGKDIQLTANKTTTVVNICFHYLFHLTLQSGQC